MVTQPDVPKESLTEIASDLGVSKATVSLVNQGKYNGSSETKERIEKRLGRRSSATTASSSVQSRGDDLPFETSGQRILRSLLQATLEDREFSLITGPSGVGKTHVAQRFVMTIPRAHYFKVQANLSTGGLTAVLCDLLQIHATGNNEQRLLRLKAAIRDGACELLVLDEADLFVNQRRPTEFIGKIEICRELFESGLAVALVGLPSLEEAIRSHTQSYIWSRLGYFAPLQAPHPDELYAFCQLCGLTGSSDQITWANRRGYFRLLKKIATRAHRVGETEAAGLVYLGDAEGRKGQ